MSDPGSVTVASVARIICAVERGQTRATSEAPGRGGSTGRWMPRHDAMEVSMKIPSVLARGGDDCGVFLLAAPSFAHHSFAAEFDGKNCRDFTGVLTKTRLAEPARVFLHGHQGCRRQGGELVVSDLRAHHAEEKRNRSAAVHREHRQGSVGQRVSRKERQERITPPPERSNFRMAFCARSASFRISALDRDMNTSPSPYGVALHWQR